MVNTSTHSFSGRPIWLESAVQSLSCAWRICPLGISEAEGALAFGDFYSSEFSGYNLDLTVTVEPKSSQGHFWETVSLKSLSQTWDHAVLNEVFSNRVTVGEARSPEWVASAMFLELKPDIEKAGGFLKTIQLGITEDWSVVVTAHPRGAQPIVSLLHRFEVNSAVQFSSERGHRSDDPYVRTLELHFEGPLQPQTQTVLDYGNILSARLEFERALRKQRVDKVVGAMSEQELSLRLFDWFRQRLPSLYKLQCEDTLDQSHESLVFELHQ